MTDERRAARSSPAWEAALLELRARAPTPRGLAAHAPRLRRRPRRARRVGDRARAASPGELALPRPARLRGGALGARARAGERRPQARRGPEPPRPPGAHRGGGRRTPPSSCRARSAARACRACSARDAGRAPARADPGVGRRSRCATARCSSSPTPAGCAPRRSSASTSTTLDFESETVRVTGKGVEDADRADRRAGAAGAASATSSRRRPALGDRPRRSRRCSSRGAGGGSRPRTSAAGSSAGCARRPSPGASRRTRCATRSPPICSRAAPICARSRSSSATPASRPPRSTRGSSRRRLRASTHAPIRAPERATDNVSGASGGADGDERQSRRAPGALAPLQGGRRRARPRAPRRRLLAAGQVHRRPDGLRACPRTSRRPTSSPTACSA